MSSKRRFYVFLEFISNSRVNYSFTKMKILIGLDFDLTMRLIGGALGDDPVGSLDINFSVAATGQVILPVLANIDE